MKPDLQTFDIEDEKLTEGERRLLSRIRDLSSDVRRILLVGIAISILVLVSILILAFRDSVSRNRFTMDSRGVIFDTHTGTAYKPNGQRIGGVK